MVKRQSSTLKLFSWYLCLSALFIFMFGAFADVSNAAAPLAPANNSEVTTLTPQLSWQADTNATQYDLWLFKKSKNYGIYFFIGRSICGANVTNIKLRSGVLEADNSYLWMVRTVTAQSIVGKFGASFKFTTSAQQTAPTPKPASTTAQNGNGLSSVEVALNTVADYIKAIKSKFDITMADGTSSWTLESLKSVYAAFLRLPKTFLAFTKTIERISTTSLGANIGGYVNSGSPSKIYLTNLGAQVDLVGVIVHEMTHCFHLMNNGVMNSFINQFWGARNSYTGQITQKSSSVSAYGNTNPYEDLAESVRVYYMSASSMKSKYPDRYAFIKQYVMNGSEF